MTTNKVNPVELAQKGDCKAIDFLINRQLQKKGITAKSLAQDGYLRIVLESEYVPSQDTLFPFIYKGIKSLGIQACSYLEVCGKAQHSNTTAWKQRISLNDSKTIQETDCPQDSSLATKGQDSEPALPIELKGNNGTLVVHENGIKIIRKGGFLGTHGKGEREIPYSSIKSFQYAPPKGFTSTGFFYFQIDDNAPQIERKAALLDENSIQFANLFDLEDVLLPKINDVLSKHINSSENTNIFFLGDNGSLTIEDSFVCIRRNSNNFSHSSMGDKNIHYRSITAVQFKKSEKSPLGYITGFLQLTIKGGRDLQGGFFEAMMDENTITFQGDRKNVHFLKAKKLIEAKIQQLHEPSPPVNPSSSLEDLEKLAALKDKGIITEEEFQAKKRQILGI
jgi:hypothetical protein